MDIDSLVNKMCFIQNELNLMISDDWMNINLEWENSIVVKLTELIKDSELLSSDLLKIRNNVVSLWFNILSYQISNNEVEKLIHSIKETEERKILVLQSEFNKDVKEVIKLFLISGFDYSSFSKILEHVGLTFEELYRSYFGKNVLYRFRRTNGSLYNEYEIKWNDGNTDFHHIQEIISKESIESLDLKTLFLSLTDRYEEINSK